MRFCKWIGSQWRRFQRWRKDPVYKLRTLGDFLTEEYFAQHDEDKEKLYFTDETASQLEKRAAQLKATYWKLYAVTVIMLLYLVESVFKIDGKLTVPILNLSLNGFPNELILLTAAMLGFGINFINVQASYLANIAFKLNQLKAPASFSHSILDRTDTITFFNVIMRACIRAGTPFIWKSRYGFVVLTQIALGCLLIFVLFLWAISITALELYIVVNLWGSPSLPPILSHSAIVLAFTLGISTWIVSICAYIPFRYIDTEVMRAFQKIQERDEEEAQEWLLAIRKEAFGKHAEH